MWFLPRLRGRGTAEGGGRGGHLLDVIQHLRQAFVTHYIRGGNANDANLLCGKPAIPLLVMLGLTRAAM